MSVEVDNTRGQMAVGELVPYTGVLRCKGIVDGSIVGELRCVGVGKGRSTTQPTGVILGIRELPKDARLARVTRGACLQTIYTSVWLTSLLDSEKASSCVAGASAVPGTFKSPK